MFSQYAELGNCKHIVQCVLKELSMFQLRKVLVLWTWNHHVLSIYWLSTVGFVPSDWRKFLVEHSLGLEWLKLYPVVSPPTTKSTSAEGVDEPLEGDEDEDEADPEDLVGDPEFEERFSDLPNN